MNENGFDFFLDLAESLGSDSFGHLGQADIGLFLPCPKKNIPK